MFAVNHVIFSVFFLSFDDDHRPARFTSVLATVFGFILIPFIIYTGYYCDRKSSWTIIIWQYFSLMGFLVIYALEGDNSW